MRVSYLVIWQLGGNEQSITETPVDVNINELNKASEKYERILKALEKETGEYDSVVVRCVCML